MNSTDSMRIGELAERFDLAPHVLRHWEAMGLLTPAARVNGRRRYTRDHVVRVMTIIRAKGGGMSLDQIRDVLGAAGRAERRALLERHHADLEPPLEVRVMPFEKCSALGPAGRAEHVPDLVEAHPAALGPDDRHDPYDVVAGVAAAAVHPGGGGQQAHGLPVAQHVRRQVEPFGQLADAHRVRRVHVDINL
ncbi:hypothetical protein GCM10020220_038580 [Nonomuraea rubra]